MRGALHSAQCAFAQKQTTGTIITFGISNQFITAAADSKRIEVHTGEPTITCKITPLGNKSIFAVTGMDFLASQSRQFHWDARDEAKHAFDLTNTLPGVHANSSFLNAVANRWVASSRTIFYQMIATDAAWFWQEVKDTHIRAVFAGFDDAGNIGVDDARIDLIQQERTITPNVVDYGQSDTPNFFAIGETQIASEFILQKSLRARMEYKNWQNSVKGKSPVGQASSRTIDIVRLSIRYLPPTAGVGPPIHALTVQNKGTVEWVPGMRCR